MEENKSINNNILYNGVRAVAGYNPSDSMIVIKDMMGREAKYLEVKYRKAWFLLWCQQNNKAGYLDDSHISYNPISKMVEGQAFVKVDGEIVGQSAACKPYDPENPANYSKTVFQDVGTIAMGRALSNCGFGTVNGCLEDGDTTSVLADAPVPIPNQCSNISGANPMLNIINSVSKAPDHTESLERSVSKAKNIKDVPQKLGQSKTYADIAPAGTLEDALMMPMPFGRFKGKTLGELYNEPNTQRAIVFYAGRSSTPYKNEKYYPNLVAACRMILDNERS